MPVASSGELVRVNFLSATLSLRTLQNQMFLFMTQSLKPFSPGFSFAQTLRASR